MRGQSPLPPGPKPAADNSGTKEKLAILAAALKRANKERDRRGRGCRRGRVTGYPEQDEKAGGGCGRVSRLRPLPAV